MKKLLLVLINLFICISISHSQQVYKSDKYKFQINFPDESDIHEDFGNIASVTAYFDRNASINVIVKENEKLKGLEVGEYNFENMQDSIIGIYQNSFVNFKLLESGNVNISDIKFYNIKYQFDLEEKVFISSQYFTSKDGKMYIISTGCFKSNYDYYKPIFENCASSFKFVE